MLNASALPRVGRRCALVLALLLAVSACGNKEWHGAAVIQPTIVRGLDSIERYYVDPVGMQALALAGLESVLLQDNELVLIPTPQQLIVAAGDDTIGQYPWPISSSVNVWSLFTVAVMADLRPHSLKLASLSPDDMLDAYFRGVTRGLDSFTRYSSPQQALQQRENRQGFGGVGLSLERSNGVIRISGISPENPSLAERIAIGDIVTAIDGETVNDWEATRANQALHGRVGSVLQLNLVHAPTGSPYEIALRRSEIIPNTVTLAKDGPFPMITIGRFNKETAKRVASTLEELMAGRASPLPGLVIDLRGNPGGLLDEAIETADLFLDQGVIASTQGRHRQSHQRFNAIPGDIAADVPIILLIDGGTASAAEILAAALQDHRRAVVVGSVSYGKGTVQKVLDMPNSGELALTWARYLTPSEYAIHDFGILPTICTSNYENGVAAVLKTLRKSPWQAEMRFRHLRMLQYQGPETIREFRASCPWNGQAPQRIDIDAADALLLDQELYLDALELGNRVYATR